MLPEPVLCPLPPLPCPHVRGGGVGGNGPAGRSRARSQVVLKGLNIRNFLFFSKLSSEALPKDSVLCDAVGADGAVTGGAVCPPWEGASLQAAPSCSDCHVPVPSGGAPSAQGQSTPPALSQPAPPRPGLLSGQGHP